MSHGSSYLIDWHLRRIFVGKSRKENGINPKYHKAKGILPVVSTFFYAE
jgi:hypothetical protein